MTVSKNEKLNFGPGIGSGGTIHGVGHISEKATRHAPEAVEEIINTVSIKPDYRFNLGSNGVVDVEMD